VKILQKVLAGATSLDSHCRPASAGEHWSCELCWNNCCEQWDVTDSDSE